jgi:hypothetical protein
MSSQSASGRAGGKRQKLADEIPSAAERPSQTRAEQVDFLKSELDELCADAKPWAFVLNIRGCIKAVVKNASLSTAEKKTAAKFLEILKVGEPEHVSVKIIAPKVMLFCAMHARTIIRNVTLLRCVADNSDRWVEGKNIKAMVAPTVIEPTFNDESNLSVLEEEYFASSKVGAIRKFIH